MSKKKKEILWHKKTGKFIPAKFLKPHGTQPAPEKGKAPTPAPSDRKREFAARLARQIKKAAAEGS